MALGPPYLVRIEKKTIGDVTNEIRSWLDHRKVEPVSFRDAPGRWFEIEFRTEDEAHLFERQFPVGGIAVC